MPQNPNTLSVRILTRELTALQTIYQTMLEQPYTNEEDWVEFDKEKDRVLLEIQDIQRSILTLTL